MRSIRFTGGRGAASADIALLPLGDSVRERFGDELRGVESSTGVLEEPIENVVVVERDGRWYLSLWHSVAEGARVAAEAGPVPSAGASPAALGASAPEEAVEGLIDAALDLNLDRIIGHLDPEEAAALYRYAPLFLSEARLQASDTLRSAADAGVRWDITDMDFDVESDGEDAIATLRGFRALVTASGVNLEVDYSPQELALRGSAEGVDVAAKLSVHDRTIEFDGSMSDGLETVTARGMVTVHDDSIVASGDFAGERFEATIELLEGCTQYSVRAGGTDELGCLETLMVDMGLPAFEDLGFEPDFSLVEDFRLPGVPVATHRVDGEWFVSPSGSLLNLYLSGLRSTDRTDIEQQLDLLTTLLGPGAALGLAS